MNPEALKEPFEWIVRHQIDLWPNDASVRAFIANPEMHFKRPVMLDLKDWAEGNLKTPQEYGMDQQYYGA